LKTIESYNGSWIESTTTASRRRPSMDSISILVIITFVSIFGLLYNLRYIEAWWHSRKDRRK
jgi:hypothetical protein